MIRFARAAQFAAAKAKKTAKAPVKRVPAKNLPSIASGSTLKIDGQSLGEEEGQVRLRVSGLALPVSVVEWSADSAKIRLPEFDVTTATEAELKFIRDHGSDLMSEAAYSRHVEAAIKHLRASGA